MCLCNWIVFQEKFCDFFSLSLSLLASNRSSFAVPLSCSTLNRLSYDVFFSIIGKRHCRVFECVSGSINRKNNSNIYSLQRVNVNIRPNVMYYRIETGDGYFSVEMKAPRRILMLLLFFTSRGTAAIKWMKERNGDDDDDDDDYDSSNNYSRLKRRSA